MTAFEIIALMLMIPVALFCAVLVAEVIATYIGHRNAPPICLLTLKECPHPKDDCRDCEIAEEAGKIGDR